MEIIIIISIFTILIGIAIPNLIKYKRIYELEDIASQAEYMIKFSKIKAMETTENIGVCIENNRLSIMRKDEEKRKKRDSSPCNGTALKSTGFIEDVSITGTSFNTDPRGIIIENHTYPITVCIKRDNISYKSNIYKTSIRGMVKEPC